jgi:hypothetical protein
MKLLLSAGDQILEPHSTEGGFTLHLPDREPSTIYDAAMRYAADNVPLVVLAGKEYGTGSSRDWAAKGTRLLGVRAVIAESFERIPGQTSSAWVFSPSNTQKVTPPTHSAWTDTRPSPSMSSPRTACPTPSTSPPRAPHAQCPSRAASTSTLPKK